MAKRTNIIVFPLPATAESPWWIETPDFFALPTAIETLDFYSSPEGRRKIEEAADLLAAARVIAHATPEAAELIGRQGVLADVNSDLLDGAAELFDDLSAALKEAAAKMRGACRVIPISARR